MNSAPSWSSRRGAAAGRIELVHGRRAAPAIDQPGGVPHQVLDRDLALRRHRAGDRSRPWRRARRPACRRISENISPPDRRSAACPARRACSAATAVIGLVIEAMLKIVSVVIGDAGRLVAEAEGVAAPPACRAARSRSPRPEFAPRRCRRSASRRSAPAARRTGRPLPAWRAAADRRRTAALGSEQAKRVRENSDRDHGRLPFGLFGP